MNIKELRAIDSRYRQEKPKIFQLTQSDRPSNDSDIESVERILRVKLPLKLKEFFKEFGGGDFGFETIYSATPGSDWYLPRKAEFAYRIMPKKYLPISDNGAGGYYVLKIENGVVGDEVYYFDSDDGSVQPMGYADLLEFISKYAYEPA
jgi:hypothetical protein